MKQISFLLFICFLAACTIKTYKPATGSAAITATQSADANKCFITGKIIDAISQEELIGASVKLRRNNDLVQATITDLSGDFRMQVDSGTYDILCSYTGFATFVQPCVQVKLGETISATIRMKSMENLEYIDYVSCTIPIIQPDKTSGGQTFTSEQLGIIPPKSVISLGFIKKKKRRIEIR
jgi:hypothetical protein